jgi:Cu+-exporting ATPase
MITEDFNNTTLYFCCKGCQGVYHLLVDENLDSFYNKKGKHKLSQPLALHTNGSEFDLDTFNENYVSKNDDGFCCIDLIIEGIHCSACIWLNEKVLNRLDGIVDVNINFTNHKGYITWDDQLIDLSTIIEAIRGIGYNAYPYKAQTTNKKVLSNKRDYFSRLSVAIFASINIMMIDVAKYSGYFSSLSDEMLKLIHFAEFIFATPVLFYSAFVFFKGGYFGIKNKIINMDFLVAFGASLTYIYSLYVLFTGDGHSYFDSVAMIITFVLTGKYLEVMGKNNASDTIDKIKSEIPYEATVIRDNEKIITNIQNINIGDILELKNGAKASVDGILLSYNATFNQSNITGESKPIAKNKGDMIYSATINTSDMILYKATKTYENSTFNTIIQKLEKSLNSRPKIQDFTNDISKHFSLSILVISFISFLIWYFYTNDFETSLIIAISVIVIACPCALALATPIASLVGISWLNQKSLLFKEAKHIETFTKVKTIVFDKTGTLTTGQLKVVQKDKFVEITPWHIDLLYSVVSTSSHLVSVHILKYLQTHYKTLHLLDIKDIKQIDGVGINCRYNGQSVFCGKSDKQTDNTNFVFQIDDKNILSFLLDDELRQEAKDCIDYLKKSNIDIIIASGDNENVVKKISDKLDIPQYKANMTPIQKADLIETLKQDGIVVMVGDGVNDTLALSKADISITLSSATDISVDISDVVILNNSLDGIKYSFEISKRTYRFIKQNLFISFIYNIITIPIAVAGYVVPLVAALSMSLSSLIVVANSFRIKNDKKG